MKYSLSPDQVEKIKYSQEKVARKQREIDNIFDTLVEELGFKEYSQAWNSSSDLLDEEPSNPMNWLFDTVYNSREEDVDDNIRKIEVNMNIYHSNHDV